MHAPGAQIIIIYASLSPAQLLDEEEEEEDSAAAQFSSRSSGAIPEVAPTTAASPDIMNYDS